MRYSVSHTTRYTYSEDVAVSHNACRLEPRDLPHQRVLGHQLEVSPNPSASHRIKDWFGNQTHHLTIQSPHRELVVVSRSTIERQDPRWPEAKATPPWEAVATAVSSGRDPRLLAMAEFALPSPLVPALSELRRYALATATPGMPTLVLADLLMRRVHKEFVYDPQATNVHTTVEEALALKRGVCQDFALVLIGALRALGIPACYVSGYLETLPPPGRPRLVGADASHAWVQAFCGDPDLGDGGWVDLDPTNACWPTDRHIAVAFGRDFSDVSPLRGLILGGGPAKVDVSVDVMRL